MFCVSKIFSKLHRISLSSSSSSSAFKALGLRVLSTEMDLKILVKRLEEYAAPYMAYESDNVGLLVEPSEPLKVNRMLVTNDLTEPVLDEAIRRQVDLIVSYHPAIYVPLKRLTQAEWKQRSIVKCIEKRIAVYSPHTTWDSVEDGINDWLMTAFSSFSYFCLLFIFFSFR